MSYSELEAIQLQELSLFILEQKLNNHELKFEDLENISQTTIFTLNHSESLEIEKMIMPDKMQSFLNYRPSEISLEDTLKYVRQEDMKRILSNFMEYAQKQDAHSVFTDFQAIKEMSQKGNYNFLLTTGKKYKDKLLTLHSPLKNLGEIAPKIEKALELDHFMRKNYEKFTSLTKTEKEVLELLALGYSNKEIGDLKNIAKATVQTHRRNIKRKLDIKHFRDLLRFAQAFDLV